jgi:predicted RNA-binding Zn ribbon-like protein
MEETIRTFSLLGNRLCLDFTNTVDDRFRENKDELLTDYRDLVAWSRQTGITTDAEASHLLAAAQRRPEEAEVVRKRAVTWREALFRIFQAYVNEADPDEEDLCQFNAVLSEAMGKTRLVGGDEHYHWDWAEKETALDWMLWPVLRSAADLLISEDLHLMRQCASEDCSWLFLDTSKNHSRRWCNMQNCGNRAKVNRHYGRKKQAVGK